MQVSVASLLFLAASPGHADPIADYVKAQMSKYGVPGLSLAILDGGRIVDARGFGVSEAGTTRAVTPTTLFLAGSISKSVAAVGALRLVDRGVLDLDDDVNVKLKSWKVPANKFTEAEKVTLRRILSHTAGLTVHGFPGYDVDAPLPSLVQILNGEKPANTPAIVVNQTPGKAWRYSGGGYTVMQQLMVDVLGQPFEEYMQQAVLDPLGMSESSFRQPPTPKRAAKTAAGVTPTGSVHGRWHLYPEMAAAGLWSTPTDLCKFIVGIQRAYAGADDGILSRPTAQAMLTDQKDGDGLGAFLESKGESLRFTHSGRDEGFDALYVGYAKTGQGVAIMINANENSGMLYRIAQMVAKERNWTDFPRPSDLGRIVPAKIAGAKLREITGYYNASQGFVVALSLDHGRLRMTEMGSVLDELIPESETSFVMPDAQQRVSFVRNARGEIVSLTMTPVGKDGKPETLPRLGGFIAPLKTTSDPNPDRTQAVRGFFKNSVRGGASVTGDVHLTPGAQKDFAPGLRDLDGFGDLVYAGEQKVTPSQVTRHGGAVATVVQYRISQKGKVRYALVYFTEDGLITDFDVVDN